MEKTKGWTGKWAALAVVWLLPTVALANGWIAHEPHRGVGGLWGTSERFALKSERLALELHATRYTAHVTYTVEDRGDTAGARRTAMYFPIACSAGEPSESSKPCVQHFEAGMNRAPLRSRLLAPHELQGRSLKLLLHRLDGRSPKPKEEAEFEARTWFVYRIEIPRDTRASELTVSYRADYAQISGGTSKSAVQQYGAASLVYDFLPAAAWAGSGTTQLQIDVDSSRMKSPLTWRQSQWPFTQVSKDAWRLVVARPDFATLPPLRLETDNSGYRRYTEQVATLRRGHVRYSVTPLGRQSKPSALHGDLKALVDRNPATFWCWRGARASIRFDFDAIALVPQGDDQFDYIYLQGLAMLNGANESLETARGHGAASKVDMSIGPYRTVQALTPTTMKTERDQYHAWASLRSDGPNGWGNGNDAASRFTDKSLKSPFKAADRKKIRQLRLKVTLTGTRTGADDENCISEIYPLFNPG